MNNKDVLVKDCKFINSELMNTGTDTYQAVNFTVEKCSFKGSRLVRKTQMALQNSNGVRISGCSFDNAEHNAINMSAICGKVEIANNYINQTVDRPLRFVVVADAATLAITNNTIISEGDDDGELMKVTAENNISLNANNITLSGNTWNDKNDNEVSAGIVDGAYIVK